MTWEIVLGLIALLGACVTVGSQVAKLSRTLALLESAVEELKSVLTDLKKDNREEHREFRNLLARDDERIRHLETKLGGTDAGGH